MTTSARNYSRAVTGAARPAPVPTRRGPRRPGVRRRPVDATRFHITHEPMPGHTPTGPVCVTPIAPATPRRRLIIGAAIATLTLAGIAVTTMNGTPTDTAATPATGSALTTPAPAALAPPQVIVSTPDGAGAILGGAAR